MAEAVPYVAAPFTGGASLLGSGLVKNALRTPDPPEAKKPATPSSPAVQQAVAEASQRRSKARGFASTILSQFSANSDLKQTYGS